MLIKHYCFLFYFIIIIMDITQNTHDYDKYIGDIYHNLLEIDNQNLKKSLTFDQTINEINNSIETIALTNTYLMCKNVLILIKYDVSNNYDDINDINVEDILPRTWRFIKHYDETGKQLFYEQLADIWNGPCSQGRVTRIFQFYISHLDISDPIYNKCLKKSK